MKSFRNIINEKKLTVKMLTETLRDFDDDWEVRLNILTAGDKVLFSCICAQLPLSSEDELDGQFEGESVYITDIGAWKLRAETKLPGLPPVVSKN